MFWYFQNSGFDARPYGSVVKPKKIGNDYGASLGGPVIIPRLYNGRDKTFFFGDFEGFRYPQSLTVQYLVPTALMKQGNFTQEVDNTPLQDPFTQGQPYPNNILPSVNPSAQAFMSIFPAPNYGNTNSVAAALASVGYNYITNKPEDYTSNQFDARVDHYFGGKALLFGRYTWKNISLQSPNNLSLPDSTLFDQYRIFVSSFSYNFTSNLINRISLWLYPGVVWPQQSLRRRSLCKRRRPGKYRPHLPLQRHHPDIV